MEKYRRAAGVFWMCSSSLGINSVHACFLYIFFYISLSLSLPLPLLFLSLSLSGSLEAGQLCVSQSYVAAQHHQILIRYIKRSMDWMNFYSVISRDRCVHSLTLLKTSALNVNPQISSHLAAEVNTVHSSPHINRELEVNLKIGRWYPELKWDWKVHFNKGTFEICPTTWHQISEGHVNILDLVSGLCLVYPMSAFQPVAILHTLFENMCQRAGISKKKQEPLWSFVLWGPL